MPYERDAQGVRMLVKVGQLPAAGIRDFIALPAPDGSLPASALRQLANCALLRLDDAAVWFLRSRGSAWSDDRLERTGRILRDEFQLRHDVQRLTERLRHELRAPSLAMLPAALREVGAVRWELRNAAIAFAIRCGQVTTRQVAARCEAVRLLLTGVLTRPLGPAPLAELGAARGEGADPADAPTTPPAHAPGPAASP